MSKSCDPGVSSQHHTHIGAIVTSSRILGEVLNDDAATLYIEWRSLPEEGPPHDMGMSPGLGGVWKEGSSNVRYLVEGSLTDYEHTS